MEDDWDLHAVVRGCAATATATTTTTTTSAVTTTSQIFSPAQQEGSSFSTCSFRDMFELHDLYKPFFAKPPQERSQIMLSPQSLPISSPHSVLGGFRDLSAEQQLQKVQTMKQLPQQKQQPFSVDYGSKANVSHNPGPRSKRRKNHTKRVCHVPADSLSADRWSWRKYGQKPIKGSPYPRGYYRCSTSKGCMAKKQVERNRSDPGMFIVTYTSEHNHPIPTHRNSLAGSTRQKPLQTPNSEDSKKPSCSPEMSEAASLSPVPEKLESSRDDLAELEDEDDDSSVSKMPLDDDFFSGLEDFTVPDAGDCVAGGHSPSSLQLPWLSNVATTTAGGG